MSYFHIHLPINRATPRRALAIDTSGRRVLTVNGTAFRLISVSNFLRRRRRRRRRDGYVRGPERAAVEAGADQQETDQKQSIEERRRRR